MYPVCPPHCLLGLGLVYHWQHCWARFAYLWFPCWLLQQMCIKRPLPCFFIAGHHHYAIYISWHCLELSVLLPDDSKEDLMAGAFVCRHKAGRWISVSSDQFGEQTAIKTGKEGWKASHCHPFPYLHTLLTRLTTDIRQMNQIVPARCHTRRKVWREVTSMKMIASVSEQNLPGDWQWWPAQYL